MFERRRVAVTGIGAVTPIGSGRERLWSGLRAERSAVGRLTRFDPAMYRSHNAAEVNDFDAKDYVEAKKVKRLDRYGTFSVACAKQAIEDSGIDMAREDRTAVIDEDALGFGAAAVDADFEDSAHGLQRKKEV